MKVLHLLPASTGQVGFVFAKRQISDLADLGIHNTILELDSPKSLVGFRSVWREIQSALSAVRYDLVHVHYGSSFGLVCALASWRRVPIVLGLKGSDVHLFPGKKQFLICSLRRAFSQLAVAISGVTICVSQRLKEQLPFFQSSIEVCPDGVNCEEFSPVDRASARNRWGFKETDHVVLVYKGRDATIKDLPLAQQAFELLRAEISTARLFVVDTQIDVSEMPSLLSACDVFLLTSLAEGSPNLVRESMAVGLPVVSVDVGDVAEQLADVRPGEVVQKRSAQLLFLALRNTLLSGRRSDGRPQALKSNRDVVARKILAAYKRLVTLSKRGIPSSDRNATGAHHL